MSFRAAGGPTLVAATQVYFSVGGTVTRADLPDLCAALAELLRHRAGGVVVCDVVEVARPDVVTVEVLARLRMTARRHGWQLVVRRASPGLLQLVALLGLTDALPQSVRQAEEREQTGGVEEVVDRGDPPG
jgi:ABC-type transporter Mla MlaB component